MTFKYAIVLSFFCLFLLSCKQDVEVRNYSYLAIGHARTSIDTPFETDEDIAEIDFEKFDMNWFLGDMIHNTVLDSSNRFFESQIPINDPNSIFVLGNHEYDNRSIFESDNDGKYYNAYYKNQLTILKLDTQVDAGQITGDQLDMITAVADSIESSQYLIVLLHKLLFMDGIAELEPLIEEVSNGPAGDCPFCLPVNNFNSTVLPILETVAAKGIDVIVVAGDIGNKTTRFEFFPAEGVSYLATGIDFTSASKPVLQFNYAFEDSSLTWEYVEAGSLK